MKHQKHVLVQSAIEAAGSQEALACAIGCVQQTVSKWLNRQIDVSAQHAIAIEQATKGVVLRWQLRPDLFEAPKREALG